MSFEAVDFYVNDTSPTANPVSGVTVKVTSQDGTLFFSQATTDSGGHAGFMLPSGATYQARFYKFQVGFTNPQFFSVLPSPLTPPQTNSFNIPATLLTPPVPLDARLCTAYGYFRDVTGAPAAYTDVHFIPRFDPVWVDGNAVLRGPAIVRSDENGYMQVNLFRSAQYDCTVVGEEDVTRCINVPDAANVNLPDLLFPIVSLVELAPPGPYTLTKGQELAVGFVVFASDGENLGSAPGDILFQVSDDTVFNYTISPAGLTLIGVGPGTGTLTVTRADRSIVHIPDAGVQNGVLSITVTP